MEPAGGVHDLLRHAEWADATVWETVLAEPETLFDDKVRFWLHHIHTVQHAFLRLWRGEGLDLPDLGAFADAPSLARWGRDGHAAIGRFLAGATEPILTAELAIPWSHRLEERFGHPPGPVTCEQSAYQIAVHSAHHRGQVAARLRELGGVPPLVDFIAWLWLGRPAPPWPAHDPSDG